MLFFLLPLLSTCLLSSWTHALPIAKRSTVTGPVITTDFPDPAAIQVDGTWYAFGSQSVFDYTSVKVQLATSTDFTTWTLSGQDALRNLPPWIANPSNPFVWAPHVIQRDDGTFLLYYSAITNTAGDGKYHCIGTAASPSIEGPYDSDSDSPFACPTAQGGAIDASGFRDADGTRYVLYKIDGNALGHGGVCGNGVPPIVATPIMIQQVQEDGVTKVGDPVELLSNGPADGSDVEAPSMVRAADGTYVLFFSSNCYSTADYDVSYATASSPMGPFTKAGEPLFVTGDGGLFGPGGATVGVEESRMVFHAYQSQEDVGGRRAMYVTSVGVSGDKVAAN